MFYSKLKSLNWCFSIFGIVLKCILFIQQTEHSFPCNHCCRHRNVHKICKVYAQKLSFVMRRHFKTLKYSCKRFIFIEILKLGFFVFSNYTLLCPIKAPILQNYNIWKAQHVTFVIITCQMNKVVHIVGNVFSSF